MKKNRERFENTSTLSKQIKIEQDDSGYGDNGTFSLLSSKKLGSSLSSISNKNNSNSKDSGSSSISSQGNSNQTKHINSDVLPLKSTYVNFQENTMIKSEIKRGSTEISSFSAKIPKQVHVSDYSMSNHIDMPEQAKRELDLLLQPKSKIIQQKEVINMLPDNNINPRAYQEIVFDNIKDNNSIVFMETGKGKTFIAIMLIAYKLGIKLNLGQKQKSNGKKVVFVVCEGSLVEQQKRAIKSATGLPVLDLVGKKNKKSKSDYETFRGLWKSADVFVALIDVLNKLLARGFLKISEITLLILDECHHTDSDHGYNILMNEFYFYNLLQFPNGKLPQILGLTASPLKNKITESVENTAENTFIKLSENLNSQIVIDPELKSTNNGDLMDDFIAGPEQKYIEVRRHYIKSEEMAPLFYICTKYFFEPMMKLCFESIPEENNASSLKEEYKNFIQKKFFCSNLEEYNRVLCEFQYLLELKNNYAEFGIFERIFRHMFMMIENMNLSSIRNLIKKNLLTYKRILDEKDWDYSEGNDTDSDNSDFDDSSVASSVKNEFKEIKALKQASLEGIVEILKIFTDVLNKCEGNQVTYTSLRLEKLTETVLEIMDSGRMKKKKHKIIIFVSNRIVSENLALHLNQYSSNALKISATSVVGVNNKKVDGAHNPRNSVLELNRRIAGFNDDKYNILIGTSTVEEGLDIQSCDVVIVYSQLRTAKSYIQMKGRARQRQAKFCVFTEDAQRTQEDIIQFIELSNCMRDLFPSDSIAKRFMRKDFILKKKLEYKTYLIEQTHAKISVKNATAMFNEIKQQMKDGTIKIKDVEHMKTSKAVANGSIMYHSCVMQFEFSKKLSGILQNFQVIKSEAYPTKGMAEGECYLLLMEGMHKLGLLDDNLKYSTE